MGETPHRLAKDASLPNLWGLSPATIERVAAVPMPGKATTSGATWATSGPRCASRSAISAESASYRRATERSANLVAAGTSLGPPARRKRAATQTSSFVESPRKRLRSSSGAVRRKPWSWLAAFRSSPNHRGATGRTQGPDHLHAPVGALGHARGFSGQHRPCGAIGVRRVRLLEVAARAWPPVLRALHLQHLDLPGPQMAGELKAP
jgi:hypothetical protein